MNNRQCHRDESNFPPLTAHRLLRPRRVNKQNQESTSNGTVFASTSPTAPHSPHPPHPAPLRLLMEGGQSCRVPDPTIQRTAEQELPARYLFALGVAARPQNNGGVENTTGNQNILLMTPSLFGRASEEKGNALNVQLFRSKLL